MINVAADPNPNYRFEKMFLNGSEFYMVEVPFIRYELMVRGPEGWVAHHRDIEKDSEHDPEQIEKELFDMFRSRYRRTLKIWLKVWWANNRLRLWWRCRRRSA